jgi:hypothetical protein
LFVERLYRLATGTHVSVFERHQKWRKSFITMTSDRYFDVGCDDKHSSVCSQYLNDVFFYINDTSVKTNQKSLFKSNIRKCRIRIEGAGSMVKGRKARFKPQVTTVGAME